jgi:hypothetical protein
MVLFFRGFSFLLNLMAELPAADASVVAASLFNLLIRLLTGSRLGNVLKECCLQNQKGV